ncbi:unnamed protein product [Rhizophagus irregularis]|nr:unnamed protein product [Rhizophagus irregularis]
MRIPFACAFIELLASDNNTNYASYLLNFGLALFSPGIYKLTQNKMSDKAEVPDNCPFSAWKRRCRVFRHP